MAPRSPYAILLFPASTMLYNFGSKLILLYALFPSEPNLHEMVLLSDLMKLDRFYGREL
jgi:hypothetical protein